MLNGKATIVLLIVRLIKRHNLNELIFSRIELLWKNRVESDLSNYATKEDLKSATADDTSDFDQKTDLANLKFDVDKLGTDELKNVPNNLSNLKSKVDKLDVDKLVLVHVDLRKLNDLVKKWCF